MSTKTFLIEYASGESSATVGKTWPVNDDGTTNQTTWFQTVGAGTVVAVCEGGTIFTRHAVGGEVYKGRFTSLTSTTCTYCIMGNGPPPPAVQAGTNVATASVAGAAALSVAPAVSTAPIAVGTNDPRVTTVEIPVQLTIADGTFAESTVWIPGVVGTITAATLSSNSDIAQSNTNYLTFALAIRDGAGGSSSPVASQVSKASGASFLGFRAVSLGTITNPTTTATSQVTFASAKTSAGQAVTGTALLRITYTVP